MKNLELSHPLPKEDRRVSRTKRNINTAFLELLKRKELSKITIKELCDLADINRKTFYNYFSSVSDVLSEIENEIIGGFQSRISELKATKSTLTVSDIILCIGDLLHSNSKFIQQLVLVDALEGLEKKVKHTLKDAVENVIAPEQKKESDIMNLALEYAISGAVSIYIEWFLTNSEISIKTLTDITIGLVKSSTELARSYAE